jgi:hypothetical protein
MIRIAVIVAALALAACGPGGAPSTTPGAATGTATALAGTSTANRAMSATPSPGAARSATASPSAETPEPPGSATAGESGIEGIVLAGPTCPVERADSPCPDRPVSLRIGVFPVRSGINTPPQLTFTSGEDGRFRVAVPPGMYVLETACGPQSCTPLPQLKPAAVAVQAGRYTDVTLSADTGIR